MNSKEENSVNFLKSKVIQPGFKVPNNYFDTFESRLEAKIFEESLPNKTGFTVPEKYFDTVEKQVLSNVIPVKKGKVVYLHIVKKVLPIAAIFIVGLLLYNPFNTKNKDYQSLLATVKTSEIETYLLNNTHKYSTSDVVEVFDNQLDNLKPIQESSIQTNVIEEYLLENANEADYDIY